MLSAAGSLAWYRDTFAPGVGFDALLAEAAGEPPGSDGLTLRHGRGHATRAVLEGVAFGLRDNLELLRPSGLGFYKQEGMLGGRVACLHM